MSSLEFEQSQSTLEHVADDERSSLHDDEEFAPHTDPHFDCDFEGKSEADGLFALPSSVATLAYKPEVDPFDLDEPEEEEAGFFALSRPEAGKPGDASEEVPIPWHGEIAPSRRIDMTPAAMFYLQSQTGNTSPSLDLSESSKVWDQSITIFKEIHQSSPEAAENLAKGLIGMPALGDTFLGFTIVEELGRGAFGRVFLASQGELADRHVALKISAELPSESQTLAQLQHTNIVPIFSAHHAPPLHAVCMPYFGRATLADVLRDVEGEEILPDSGKALLKTLGSRRSSMRSRIGGSKASDALAETIVMGRSSISDLESKSGSEPEQSVDEEEIAEVIAGPQLDLEVESETLRTIGNLSYVGAVLWMGARIADGLAHAHRRGILHRDLKPANILMTDDGQPMILDFNLSEDTKSQVGAASASAVGTLPYMPPESIERFLGKKTEVDARSDLYALGIMLFELLTGRHPFEVYADASQAVLRKMVSDRAQGAPDAFRFNPAITPAVNSILKRCLEADPSKRYRSASEIHEDLERHLADLPLKHAPEPSLRERSRKWVRRHPRLGSTSTAAIVAIVMLAILGSAMAVRGRRLVRLEAARELVEFRQKAAGVRFLLNHRTENPIQRAEGENLAREALKPYGVLDDPNWIQNVKVQALPENDRERLREEVSEVLMILTQAELTDANGRQDLSRRELARSARKTNLLALATFPKGKEPQALWVQQAALVRLMGQEQEGAKLAAEAEKLPLKNAHDYYLAAAGLASRGEYAKALPLAEQATMLDPQHFWSYFILGVCHDRLEHHADAMACFIACTALRPDFAESWLYRGLAHLKRSNLAKAAADFDAAAKLRPEWYEPYLNRAIAYRELGDHLKAENDLTRAIELGAPETRTYFLRAAERQARGDEKGAEVDRAEGLKREPTDLPSWLSRGMARMEKDPEGALADFQSALKLDPKSLEALQMSAYVLSDIPGRDLDTIKMLDRIVESYPDFVPARSGRGVQYAILGRRDEALQDARESVWRDTTPAILYQVAGIYATTSKTNPEDRLEAYRLLGTALRAGFGFDLLDIDRELDAIRNEPEFKAVVDSSRAQAKERLQRPPGR